MKYGLLLLAFLVSLSCTNKSQAPSTDNTEETQLYQPDWGSLSNHNEAPDWFQNAKLGIYFHWGVYSVPAFGNEWYPRWMHFEDRPEYEHHINKYGHPSEFGYHDFVPMFKAENFNAAEWVDLFQKAGARFAGPVAEHHDGFSMWDSDVTPWNSMDMGPKKDITGLLAEELRKKDMKLITTFHHAKHLQRREEEGEGGRKNWNSHYPIIEGMPTLSKEDNLDYLYGNIPEEKWLEEVWLAKVEEVTEKYQPDIIWFDSWLDQIPESYRQRMASDYLNKAKAWGKEVVIVRKQDDLPLEMSVDDLEKSRKNRLEKKSWMTDETLSTGSWCYTENLKIKETADVLHVLIDITSKNGVLLLNISPKADGSIPNDQKDVLLELGTWLDKYGAAIYDTRPWYTFGEGPTKEPEGNFKNHREFLKIKYSEKDIRYTTKGDNIYAIFLGRPQGKVLLESFAKSKLPSANKVSKVTIPGLAEEVKWKLLEEGLEIEIPKEGGDEMALVLKITP